MQTLALRPGIVCSLLLATACAAWAEDSSSGDEAWKLTPDSSCVDSSATDADFWNEGSWEDFADPCDLEASVLFPASPERPPKENTRASFAMTRGASGEMRGTLRQQAEADGWSDRVEVRGDTLTRRRVGWESAGWESAEWSRAGWSNAGWKASVGDLDDPAFLLWPRAWPRRRLPRGWQQAKRPRAAGYGLSSPMPQGLAVGVRQSGWTAWASRAWNPVATGKEPAWNPAWDFHHVSTGITLALPWTVTGLFTDTRVTRGTTDSMAEQTWATEITSPGKEVALSGGLLRTRTRERPWGWALATQWHHRFGASLSTELLVRQRGADWVSAWDAAVSEDAVEAAARDTGSDSWNEWGAGEYRAAGQWKNPRTRWSLEDWRAWDPRGGTLRTGTRARAEWHTREGKEAGEDRDLSLRLTGTMRRARTASGSVSRSRFLEAASRVETSPAIEVAAWRAWNGDGPTRAGGSLGIEVQGDKVQASSTLKVEQKKKTDAPNYLETLASLGARWRFARGWNLDAAASAPVYPGGFSSEARDAWRWRVTFNYARTGR